MREELDILKKAGLYRELKSVERYGKNVLCEGVKYLNFASNDYLGFSTMPELQSEFFDSFLKENKDFVMSSGSSRLLAGNYSCFDDYERKVGKAYGKSCLFLNCGYHANTGILPSLAGKDDLLLVDKLSHASIMDSIRLTDAKWMRFAHNDYGHLRKILTEERSKFKKVFIVTESVFSMDGDTSDIAELVAIKKEFDCMLYVDEAHSVGVYGKNGMGFCHESGMLKEIDIVMCTLGKGMGGEGAFVLCSEYAREMLINKCRTFIFTTAIAPINLLWNSFVFDKMQTGCFENQRLHLKKISELFREKFSSKNILGSSQIVPMIIGDNESTLKASEKLRKNGIYAPAIRYPSVPKNSGRIRFSLSSALGEDEILSCAKIILDVL